ncbi:MAG: hypothetical protein LH630_09130 [Actinomycetia bacterium]|nr:hypothetical protein [Actinomycetes bacterium]
MSAGKKRAAVDETTDGDLLSDGDVLAEAVIADAVVEPMIDPELDRVPDSDTPGSDVPGSPSDDPTPEGAADDGGATATPRSKAKFLVGALLALAIAAGAVWAAGILGGSGEYGLPESVAEPIVVIAALEQGGIECTGAAVSGDVATCNATMAVRIFESPIEAEKWVTMLLRDPQTSSAIGWVRHGNVVVAAPLNAAPGVSAALGAGSQIY